MTKNLLAFFVFFVASCASLMAQQRIITGKVRSSDDSSAIPGVNVLESGTANGTATDRDGNFTINVGPNATLTVSFIGYKTTEVPVGTQTTVDILLEPNVTALEEIVVVGYGEVQKKDATGAVANLSTKDFNKGVITSPQDLIVGKFAGVSVTSNSGAPGAGSTIRIRGGSSLGASNDPLIVIDGFPIDNTNPGGQSNPLASINPNDIETFTVLKDASATAIYGSRASNGVIIITTKKGSEGKPKFTYNGTVSIATPIKYVDVLNGDQFRSLATTLGATGVSGIDAAALTKLGTSNTDWQREIFQTAISSDHNFSVSGSMKQTPYRISYGYTNQEGILKTTGMERNSLNINVTPTMLGGDLKLNLSAKGSTTATNFGEPGAVGSAVAFDPTQPVYDPNASESGGYFSWRSKNAVANSGIANPVAQLYQTENRATANRIIANAQGEYKLPFAEGLKLNVNVGIDRATSDGYNRVPVNGAIIFNGATFSMVGRNNTYSGRNQSELADVYLNYLKQFGDHKIDFTGGYGYQHFYREQTTQNSSAAQTPPPSNPKSENYLVSFFGRVNYALNSKYLITATLRADGSSRFSKDNRWGIFPSVAAAWRIKDEAFLANADFFSDLKLRVGYGVTGQQDIGYRVVGQPDVQSYYPYLPTYQSSDALSRYQLGNTFYTTQRPNPYDANIKWESTATTNIGLDFGFFGDKLTGSVEVFQKKTSNLLNNIAIPNGVNFSNFLTTNVGSMENQGIEITLRATPIASKDFTWNIGFNFTAITSKITKLNLTDDPNYIGNQHGGIGVNANIQVDQVGGPANAFFVYQQVYDANGKPVEGLYVDRSGKGGSVVGNLANFYRYQRPAPDYLIGINSRLNYKKFDFSFSGRASIGNYVYNQVQAGRAFYNSVYNLGYFANTLTAVNDTKFVTQQTYSDYYVQNGSFFRMDNISLGYTFDRAFLDKVKARLSVTVQNAFLITNYKGLDPEVIPGGDNNGIDNNIYPRPRTILFGVNVTF